MIERYTEEDKTKTSKPGEGKRKRLQEAVDDEPMENARTLRLAARSRGGFAAPPPAAAATRSIGDELPDAIYAPCIFQRHRVQWGRAYISTSMYEFKVV